MTDPIKQHNCAEVESGPAWREAMGPERNPTPFSNQASAFGQGFRAGMKYAANRQHTCWNCGSKVPRLPEDIARGQANTDAVVRGEAMPEAYEVDHRGAPSLAVEREIVVGSTWANKAYPGITCEVMRLFPDVVDSVVEFREGIVGNTGKALSQLEARGFREFWRWVSDPQPESPDARSLATEGPNEAVLQWGDATGHDGAGWYYWDAEYQDEGSVGAFPTRREAETHAREAGYNKFSLKGDRISANGHIALGPEPTDTVGIDDDLNILSSLLVDLQQSGELLRAAEGREALDRLAEFTRIAHTVMPDVAPGQCPRCGEFSKRETFNQAIDAVNSGKCGLPAPRGHGGWCQKSSGHVGEPCFFGPSPEPNDTGVPSLPEAIEVIRTHFECCGFQQSHSDAFSVIEAAVRRVQEQAPQAEAAAGELYVPKVGERVRVLEVAARDRSAALHVGAEGTVREVCQGFRDFWNESYTLITFMGGPELGTWCRVEPITEPIPPATPRSEPAPPPWPSAIEAAESYRSVARQRDEALAKVAELTAASEKLRECLRNIVNGLGNGSGVAPSVSTGFLLQADGETLSVIRGLRSQLSTREAELARLTGDCNELRSGLHMHEVHSKLQEAVLYRVRVELTDSRRANGVAGAELHRLIAELATRTAELEAARQLLRYSCSLLKPRFQPNYTRDEDHVRAVERFLAESPEPAPGVEAPEVGK